tara:strand:+ start:451 stop:633 length:183 start_codon:yes stop_codon:yes gene_type:complete
MFGNYKKSYIKRENLYIIFFGTKKENKNKNKNKNSFIELINVLYFINETQIIIRKDRKET